jgi:SET domain-containing protein
MAYYVDFVEGKGRGVFTDKKIHKGETIESAQVVEFPEEQWKDVENTVFGFYCYFWGSDIKGGAMVLGNGSLYNHSYNPNAIYLRKYEDKIMEFMAIKDIEAGEEITINYNGSPDNNDPLWFEVHE